MEDSSRLDIKYFKGLLLNKENYEIFEKTGYNSIELIIFTDAYQIHKRTQLSLDIIYNIQTNLLSYFGSVPINGYQFNLNKQQENYFNSGIGVLDELLQGEGFKCGEIYEIVGPSSSGKTQISMLSSLNIVKQYSSNTVIYIDSSNSFSSNRLVEVYKSNYQQQHQPQQLDEQESYNNNNNNNNKTNQLLNILDRIKVINCFDSTSLMNLLNNIEDQLINKDSGSQQQNNNSNNNNNNNSNQQNDRFYKNLKMIVIDSIGTILSPIIGGRQTQGHFIMMNISRHLKAIANDYNIVFLITNNTVSNSSSSSSSSSSNSGGSTTLNDNKAALAESWAVVSNHQLMINHFYFDDEDEERSIYIERSTRFKRKDLVKGFSIQDNGIF